MVFISVPFPFLLVTSFTLHALALKELYLVIPQALDNIRLLAT